MQSLLYSLLVSLVCITTSCTGQVKTAAAVQERGQISGRAPKLVKTQGTDSGANVHCGLQDKHGNLWFGTTGEGVYRYDGTSFTNFTEKDGLSDNDVWWMMEDKAGNIWFGTSNGASRYDGTGFTTIRVTANDHRPSFPRTSTTTYSAMENTVWCIVQDKAGNYWFGTPSGIYRYDGTSFVSLLDIDGVVDESTRRFTQVESIVEDRAGTIWFGGRGSEGLYRFDGRSLTHRAPAGKGWARPLLEDRSGNIWCNCGPSGVYRYDGATFTRFAKEEFSGWIVDMAEEEGGNLWFADDDGGVARYDGTRLEHFTTNDGLAHNSVFSVMVDRGGSVWVGTRGVGLSRYDRKSFAMFSE